MEITVGLAMSPGSWIFKEEPLVSLVQDFFLQVNNYYSSCRHAR